MADEHIRQERALRERIERTRAHMGDTIEEIADHLDPDHLKHEFKAGVREQVEETKQAVRSATIGKAEKMMHDVERTASETGRTLMDTIRENPLPAAMAGIGLGWLIAETRRSQAHHAQRREYALGGVASTAPGYVGGGGYTAPPMSGTEQARAGASMAGHRVREEAEGAADRVREEARHTADQVRHTASDVADQARGVTNQARTSAARMAHEAQHSAERAWHEAEHRAHQAQTRAQRTAQESPLAAGAIVLALGFAAGLTLPETQKERQVMGPTRDRLVDRAQQAAGQAGQKAMHAAEGVAKQAKSTVESAVKSTAKDTMNTVKDAAEQAGVAP